MKPSDIAFPTPNLVNASAFSKSNVRTILTKLLSAVLLSFFLVIPNSASADLNTGLMAWWPLDGNAVDASGNGNNGQVNGPVPCEDRFGNPSGAMCFNGALSQYINIGNRVKPPFPFTITAWIKPDILGGDKVIIRNDLWSSNYYGAEVVTTDGTRLAGAYGDGGPTSGISRTTAFTERGIVTAGDWQHVVVVFNAHRNVRLYRNCIEYPAACCAGTGDTMRYSTANGAIGVGSPAAGTAQNYTGAIDDVRVYSRSLSSEEIGSFCQESPDWFGNTLQTGSSYEFALEQGAQKTESIQLLNPGTVTRTATLAIVNPFADLTISLPPGPITITPGETETLSLQINAASVSAGVYDGILLKITVDDGSTLYANLKVYVTASAEQLPDLAISATDIRSTSNTNNTVTLTADIHNQGLTAAANVQVQFYEFGNALGSPVTIAQIVPKGSDSASITVPALTAGDHLIRVVVDPAGALTELDKTNNEASRLIPIGSSTPTAGNILVTGSLPTTVYTNPPSTSLFTLSGRAVYDLSINGVRNTDYVVKGGSVQITVKAKDSTGPEWVYGNVHTDVEGNFAKTLEAPAAAGAYDVIMTVTDKTFVGTRKLTFNVDIETSTESHLPSPPTAYGGVGEWTYNSSTGAWTWVWTTPPNEPVPASDLRVFSEDINFSNDHPASQEEITVFAAIRYWASSSALVAQNVPINIYATSPGTPKVQIGQTVLPSLRVDSPDFGARYVYATWKNQGDGIYLIEFEIDPSYAETNQLNNAATRAIIVGQVSGSTPGVISGQVVDPSGGVGNVMVHVLDANGQPIGNALTDATGFYLVGNLPLGALQVHIDTPSGYTADAETKAVTVANQAVSTVYFHLTPKPADTTPPVITPKVTGTGNNGWYTSNVTVSWDVTDAESTVNSTSGCGNNTVTADTVGVTFTCSATSSGGTTEKSVTIKRDATAPTITGSASPAANLNGWRNSPVTVSFTCNDAGSGIDTCADSQTLGNEGANQTANGTATDKAGNTASASVTGISIDRTPPTVSVTGVADGATYTGSAPPAGCLTTDTLSGVQSQAALSVTGSDANGLRTFTATCAGAMDNAGNVGATVSVTYYVTSTPSSTSAFSAFNVNPLRINQRLKTFFLLSTFTLGTDSNGIDPVNEPVTLTIANFTTTIPVKSFRQGQAGVYAFAGKINNVALEVLIAPLGNNRFGFQAAAYGADLSGATNPVAVGLTLGNDQGTTSVNAAIIK